MRSSETWRGEWAMCEAISDTGPILHLHEIGRLNAPEKRVHGQLLYETCERLRPLFEQMSATNN